MAGKPSQRRSYKQEEMELNLTPMMNLIAILIPCLLISVAFVEVAVVNVAVPAIGPSSTAPPTEQHPPVNLTVTVSRRGYLLASSIGLFEGNGAPGLFIPAVQRTVSCKRYLGTVPPPRSQNQTPPCKTSDETRTFVVYDLATFKSKLVEVKDKYPDERRLIVSAEPDLEFEAITDVIDQSRDLEREGEVQPLFDEIVFRPYTPP